MNRGCSCVEKTVAQLDREGCSICGLDKKKPKTGSFHRTVEEILKGLDALRKIPLTNQPGVMTMPTKEDVAAERDAWVTKHRKLDESETQANARFWKENPEAKEASRNAGVSSDFGEGPQTVGEVVTKAIDRKARGWHAEGLHFDVSLPVLRGRIRKSMPTLAELERSTESVAVAKMDIQKSTDPDLRQALDFLSTWG